jgi:hypothetical protein
MRARQADATLVIDHRKGLERLAASGHAWAREALDPASPLLFVSTAGFKSSFLAAAEDLRQRVVLWTIEDLF